MRLNLIFHCLVSFLVDLLVFKGATACRRLLNLLQV
jgi:hypothetical protein